MKNFMKHVFANIVAILLLCCVFFGFLIIFVVAASKNSGSEIRKNSVLTLDMDTSIIESPTDIDTDIFSLSTDKETILAQDIIDAIYRAKTDNNIAGISIELDAINADLTQIDGIREAIEDFKTSKKFVYAYTNNTEQLAYYLGSVADTYFLNPTGSIDLKGLSSEVIYFKDFTEKYGIDIDIIRHGKYKAAVEPFLRNDISEENKEQISTLLNDVWNNISKKISASRKISETQLKTITDSLYGFIPDNGLKYKLVDKLVQKSEYDGFIKKSLKLNDKDKLNKVYFADYIKSTEQKQAADKVGILYASGKITEGDGYSDIQSETFIKHIKKLKDDDKVKSVVLRINSPGGSANASDQILFELQQLKTKKPLVVSFGGHAASGGYYIAMAGNKIYSEANTVTGSIGVFGSIMSAKTLANRNGIRSSIVQTNANSHTLSPTSTLSGGMRSVLQQSIEHTYKRFVGFVMNNRKMSFEAVDNIGGGRIWSGTRAKEIGLVDEIGGLSDAIKYAADLAKLKNYEIKTYPKEISKFEQLFFSSKNEDIATKIIKTKINKEQFRLYQMLTDPKQKSNIIMMNPYNITLR